jgi:hypothetical protein
MLNVLPLATTTNLLQPYYLKQKSYLFLQNVAFLICMFAQLCGHEVGDIRAAALRFMNFFFLKKTLDSW